jgi:two-component system nitrate/nitrite response regulator NarL
MKLLLCDDHDLFNDALAFALRQRGDAVTVTSSPHEALALAEKERFDVCVMDLHFPDGDGLTATRHLTALSTRVLVLSGEASGSLARRALQAGARGVLRKDRPLADVVTAIERVSLGELLVDRDVVRPEGMPRRFALTRREQQQLELMARGLSTYAIAREMQVTYNTTRAHTQNILQKLGVHTRLEAVRVALRQGLVMGQGVGLPEPAGTGTST